MQNLASVVVTTYNGERYIIEQLQSILEQSYLNIEVYVIDDCSTDNTVRLVNDFIRNHDLHNNWQLIVNDVNKGWRKNFIDGMKLCKGDFIFPCDQDDIWNHDKISKMICIMNANDGINVLASNIMEFFENGKTRIRPLKEDSDVKKHAIVKNFFDNEYPGCSFCVRRSFFEKIEQFWWEKQPHDALLWRYAMFSDSLYTVSECLIKQRIHSDSTYSVESVRRKTKTSKMEEIEYMQVEVKHLREFLKLSKYTNQNGETILVNTEEWLRRRSELYNQFSIKNCLRLLPFILYYERKRKYVLDVILAGKKE